MQNCYRNRFLSQRSLCKSEWFTVANPTITKSTPKTHGEHNYQLTNIHLHIYSQTYRAINVLRTRTCDLAHPRDTHTRNNYLQTRRVQLQLSRFGFAVRRQAGKQKWLGSIPLRLSLLCKKIVVCGHFLVTLSLTIYETLKWLQSLPILMQESFWW